MASVTINVTELVCACLDEKWRHKWLTAEGKKPKPYFQGGATGGFAVKGREFHKAAERFVEWLTATQNNKEAVGLNSWETLWPAMRQHFAQDLIDPLMEKADTMQSGLHLAKALKSFCGRLLELRQKYEGFENWGQIFVTQEYDLRDIHFTAGDQSIFVSGRPDVVRVNPDRGLEVVDYKLSQGGRGKHDLLQLSIYLKMLSQHKSTLRYGGVLEYYEPELVPVEPSDEQVEAIFEDVVTPVLFELTGQSPPLKVIGAKGARVEPDVRPDVKPGPDLDEVAAKIEKVYADFKLSVKVVGQQEAPQLFRYMVQPAGGVKVVSLVSRAPDLQVQLNLPMPPVIEPARGYVTIDVPKENPDTVQWREVINRPEYEADQSPVSFPVGIGVDNMVVSADFADPNSCHALVAGVSGSGKSEFLKAMVASLLIKNNPASLNLTIIDPKMLTFQALAGSPFLTHPVLTDIEQAVAVLEKAAIDMDDRYRRLARENYENLSQRLGAGKSDLPFRVIIFDEFSDMILAGKDEKRAFESAVSRLAVKGRAAGIHLVLATQRPDRKVVTGQIKSNLPLKVCMRVNSRTDSSIILDQGGGESLLGRGDLLLDQGKGPVRVQSPYITQKELAGLVGN